LLNRPPGATGQEWYTNPKILIGGGVALVAAFILLRKPATTTQTPEARTNPVGGTSTYLDGTGMQHIVATDPQGNLVGYNSLPPSTSVPQTGQLSTYAGNMSTYAGSMAGVTLQQPYGGWTPPYYSQTNWQQYNPMGQQ
jgi:hypothetical protein